MFLPFIFFCATSVLHKNKNGERNHKMPGRKYIDPNDPDLPDNFIVLENDDWIGSLHKIEREMRCAPVNYGNFIDKSVASAMDMNPYFFEASALGQLITRLMNNNHFEIDTQGCTSETDIERYFCRAFNDISGKAQLDQDDQLLLRAFFDYLQAMTKPLLLTWPNHTLVSLRLRGNDFTVTKPQNFMFLQGASNNGLLWRGEPFFGSTFHVRMSFNTLANAVYDDKTLIQAREKEYKPGGLNYYDKPKLQYDTHEDVWHPKPWSVSVLSSNIWMHRPVIQSSPRPMNFSGRQERRVTFSAVVQRL